MQLGDRVNQHLAVIADSEVCRNMSGQLRLTVAERRKHRESQKFTCFQVETLAHEVVPEAIGGQILLDV
jgi:hypothetical protein